MFNVGDVVISDGGIRMTVVEITIEGVRCLWFEGTTLRGGSFSPQELTLDP